VLDCLLSLEEYIDFIIFLILDCIYYLRYNILFYPFLYISRRNVLTYSWAP